MQHPPYAPDWATPCRESLPVTERAVLDLMSYVPWQALAALLVIGLVTIATGIGLLTFWCSKIFRDAWNKYHRRARRKPADPLPPQGRPALAPGTPPLPEGARPPPALEEPASPGREPAAGPLGVLAIINNQPPTIAPAPMIRSRRDRSRTPRKRDVTPAHRKR